MGKAPKLLTILVDNDMTESPLIQQLQEQGHTILTWQDGEGIPQDGPDLVIGRNCWRYFLGWKDSIFKEAIKESRMKKYGVAQKSTSGGK